MNQWAARHPEEYERRLAEGSDSPQRDAMEESYEHSNEPCCVCAEVTTPGGRPCRRCEASMEEDRLNRA